MAKHEFKPEKRRGEAATLIVMIGFGAVMAGLAMLTLAGIVIR